jgi:hypothetical protein
VSLDELEQDFRARTAAEGSPLVILALQMREDDVRGLRPYLAQRSLSLSEYVRALIIENRRRFGNHAPMSVAMMEVR